MTDNPSHAGRQAEALEAIAAAGREIAGAIRETKFPGRDGSAEAKETPENLASGCRNVSPGAGTLGSRLRAAADYQDRPGAYDELRAMADEADRLEAARERQRETIEAQKERADRVRALAREWARRGSAQNQSPDYGSFARALLDVLDGQEAP